MEESIFGPRKTRKKLGTDAKDGGVITERGFARRWFHHIYFAMLSACCTNLIILINCTNR
jgi:hypothetical protein